MKRRNIKKKVDYLLIMFHTPLLQRLYVIVVEKEEGQTNQRKVKSCFGENYMYYDKNVCQNTKHKKNHTF